jgi:hypothetical protein
MTIVTSEATIVRAIRLKYQSVSSLDEQLERIIGHVLRDKALTKKIVAGAVIQAVQEMP